MGSSKSKNEVPEDYGYVKLEDLSATDSTADEATPVHQNVVKNPGYHAFYRKIGNDRYWVSVYCKEMRGYLDVSFYTKDLNFIIDCIMEGSSFSIKDLNKIIPSRHPALKPLEQNGRNFVYFLWYRSMVLEYFLRELRDSLKNEKLHSRKDNKCSDPR
jgi:hypothetical protein